MTARNTPDTGAPPKSIGTTGDSLSAVWAAAITWLRETLGEATTRDWLTRCELLEVRGPVAKILLPSQRTLNQVQHTFATEIKEALNRKIPGVRQLQFVVAAPTNGRGPAATGYDWNSSSPRPTSQSRPSRNPKFTFANFIPGTGGQLIYTASQKFCEIENSFSNILFLYGRVSSGKTHLLHAISQRYAELNPSAHVVLLSAEEFTSRFLGALGNHSIGAFKKDLRSADLLLLDDMQFLIGKKATEEEFFHTLNELTVNGKRVVITANRQPGHFDTLDERIRSRLAGGLVIATPTADNAFRIELLKRRMQMAQQSDPAISYDPEALGYIANRMGDDLRAHEGALMRLLAEAQLSQVRITLELAEDRLQDLVSACRRNPTLNSIRTVVANHFQIKESDILSKSRRRDFVRARQVAMHFARQLTNESLAAIGDAFGKRDHSTVVHALQKVAEQCDQNPTFADQIRALSEEFRH